VKIDVVPYSDEWPRLFEDVAVQLRQAFRSVPLVGIEHVGSTSVPGLPAKPILDIDIIVRRESVGAAIDALATIGYEHRGDLGLPDREAFFSPDDTPHRHVYLCVQDTLHLRNHLAVREVLRTHPDLRERYGAVKIELANKFDTNIERYTAGKSDVLQDVLSAADLTVAEKRQIRELNTLK
jgi:GrpB-like predicted nucleotidyltransferase (UPF0157 family)